MLRRGSPRQSTTTNRVGTPSSSSTWSENRQPGGRKLARARQPRSIRGMAGIVNESLARLISSGTTFSSKDVRALTGVSRQAVHKHLSLLVERGELATSGKARAARYTPVAPMHQRVEVASAGSRFRLSARLLMLDAKPGEVTLDFTGVAELGDEFLDELFNVWAPNHPKTTLKVAHLPSSLAKTFFDFAKRRTEAGATGS